jgi:hypothetical protein
MSVRTYVSPATVLELSESRISKVFRTQFILKTADALFTKDLRQVGLCVVKDMQIEINLFFI